MNIEEIRARATSIKEEITRLTVEIGIKKMELKKLQKKCPHADLAQVRVFRNNVDYCNVCGFEKRFTDLDDRDERMSRKLNG